MKKLLSGCAIVVALVTTTPARAGDPKAAAAIAYGVAAGSYMVTALICEGVAGSGGHLQSARVAASSIMTAEQVDTAEAEFRAQHFETALDPLTPDERVPFCADELASAERDVTRAQEALNAELLK